MKENKLTHLPIDDIVVSREIRQRTDLTPDSVLELCQSIGTTQTLMQPISVERETLELIAGERRWTAFSLLRDASRGDYSRFTKPDEARELLYPICQCPIDLWDGWNKIPAQLYFKISEVERLVLEWTENKARQDISWQDTARAAYEIHKKLVAAADGERWYDNKTAAMLSISTRYFSELVSPLRAVDAAKGKTKEDLQRVLEESNSSRAAVMAVERVVNRHGAHRSGLKLSTSAKAANAEAPPPPPVTIESPIICEDFTIFARCNEDERFNFIHLDPPYGINYNSGRGQNTAADTRINGEYDDSPDVYWSILDALLENRKNLLYPSSHVMLWFSQNLRRETEDRVLSAWPDAKIQPFLMIWHCSDNSGLIPDPQRYGRRTYETAMLITLNDRKVVAPKAISISAPRRTGEEKIHRSQKPIEVLSHFFSMFVDSSSHVLDPTCGSGTSLIAAKKLGAARLLGLEIDPEMAEAAGKFYSTQVK